MSNMLEMPGEGDREKVEAAGGYIKDGNTFMPITYFQQASNNDKIRIIVMEMARPGGMLFATKLEHKFFTPGTELANFFTIGAYDWEQNGGLTYLVIVMPQIHQVEKELDEIADSCGLYLEGGSPVGIDPKATFPLDGSAVLHAVNVAGHKFYNIVKEVNNMVEELTTLLEEETAATVEFLKETGISDEELSTLNETGSNLRSGSR